MSWRMVVVSSRAKLELKTSNLIIRSEKESKKIHLSEIALLMIEDTASSITTALLCELIERKIKVVFCDAKRNPCSELLPYYGSHDTSLKIKKQIQWTPFTKQQVWTEIVREKIANQLKILAFLGCQEMTLLEKYLDEMQFNDTTNREGHAAKVYFNAVFGKQFSRSQDNPTNAALNYGYTILLSAFNREICSNGYITQLGLFHDNMFNQFNLSSDLMEPFRTFVDYKVITGDYTVFEREQKMELVNLLNQEVVIDGKNHHLSHAIRIYCKSIFDALEEQDISRIRFVRNEL